MPVPGEQLEPAMRQGLCENFLLLRGDPALVATEQQHRSFDSREKRPDINRFEAFVQRGGDIGARLVHLGDDPFLQIRARMFDVEPVAEGLPAPFAGAIGSYRRGGALPAERIDPADLVGNARRGIAQDEAGNPFGMCRCEK